MTYLYLEPGQDWIEISAIPKMIADALHPEVPETAPPVVSELMKKAKAQTLASQWCGNGNNFHVSLSDDDLNWLNNGPWRDLAPLKFAPGSTEPPRILSTPPTVEVWLSSYLPAVEAEPPQQWDLDWRRRTPQVVQAVKHHDTEQHIRTALQDLSRSGALTGRHRDSRVPEPGAIGDRLFSLEIPFSEFVNFCDPLGIRVTRRFERGPVALLTLELLRREPPDSVVYMIEPEGKGRRTEVWQSAQACMEDLEEEAKLQARGLFRVKDAARVLVQSDPAFDVSYLISRMKVAMVGPNRLVRGRHGLPLRESDPVRSFHDLVAVADVDRWLDAQGSDRRLSPLVRQALGASADAQASTYSSIVDWCDATLDAHHHFQSRSVPSGVAARLLCQFPENEPLDVVRRSDSDETEPEDFDRLLRVFEEHDRTAPGNRTLQEWVQIAVNRGLKYHSWVDRYIALLLPVDAQGDTPAAPESKNQIRTTVDGKPVFSMSRKALVARHLHHWPTIERDLKDASTNGLDRAKAGARDWYEDIALDWARSRGRLIEQSDQTRLSQAVFGLSSLPRTTHRLDD